MKTLLVIALLLGGGVYLQWQGVIVGDKQTQLRDTIADLANNNQQQQEKNKHLKKRLDDLRQNPEAAFEALAREKLLMIKEDEIYILPESETN
ncbi:MAG: septum formation initiator family protein [Proteobacteria bacterium]|nr:septum formation initiator family protein [Pseudomonadota bacterium]MCH9758535.1 septum formation initiator family protein [Pseudomonadota bacterium]